MKIQNIDHFVITTGNLEKCLDFYVGVLGMEHVVETSENDQHSLHFGTQKINIHTYVGEFQPAAKHAEIGCADFCLITEDDIHQVKSEIEDRGIKIIEGVIRTAGARGEMESIYMFDPDGNLVEVAAYL